MLEKRLMVLVSIVSQNLQAENPDQIHYTISTIFFFNFMTNYSKVLASLQSVTTFWSFGWLSKSYLCHYGYLIRTYGLQIAFPKILSAISIVYLILPVFIYQTTKLFPGFSSILFFFSFQFSMSYSNSFPLKPDADSFHSVWFPPNCLFSVFPLCYSIQQAFYLAIYFANVF